MMTCRLEMCMSVRLPARTAAVTRPASACCILSIYPFAHKQAARPSPVYPSAGAHRGLDAAGQRMLRPSDQCPQDLGSSLLRRQRSAERRAAQHSGAISALLQRVAQACQERSEVQVPRNLAPWSGTHALGGAGSCESGSVVGLLRNLAAI
jgi:hypothetical protein